MARAWRTAQVAGPEAGKTHAKDLKAEPPAGAARAKTVGERESREPSLAAWTPSVRQTSNPMRSCASARRLPNRVHVSLVSTRIRRAKDLSLVADEAQRLYGATAWSPYGDARRTQRPRSGPGRPSR